MLGKLKVVFLALVMVVLAGAAQADTVIPLVVGYNATYLGNWAGSPTNPFTATLTITGTKTIDSTEWWIMQFNNWDGTVGDPQYMDIRADGKSVYINDSASPHVVMDVVGTIWQDEEGRNCKIIDITSYAGFDNVYKMWQSYDLAEGYQSFEYWKPGVGFLGEFTYNYQGSGYQETKTLTAYATPVPPSLLLLGSGLLGLVALRKCGKV
jgi:hypothetical protein